MVLIAFFEINHAIPSINIYQSIEKKKLSYRHKSNAGQKKQRSPRVKICFVSFSHVSFYVLKGLSKYTEYTFNIRVPVYISLSPSPFFQSDSIRYNDEINRYLHMKCVGTHLTLSNFTFNTQKKRERGRYIVKDQISCMKYVYAKKTLFLP